MINSRHDTIKEILFIILLNCKFMSECQNQVGDFFKFCCPLKKPQLFVNYLLQFLPKLY